MTKKIKMTKKINMWRDYLIIEAGLLAFGVMVVCAALMFLNFYG